MYNKLISLFFFLLLTIPASAQIEIRTEYIGRSSYRDIDNQKTAGKGSATVWSAGFQIPLSVRQHEDKRVTLWAVSLSGSYTDFNNRNMLRELCPPEITNARVGGMFLAPVKHNKSIIASLGAGVYAAHTRFSHITSDELMFDGAAVLVWHLRPNLDIGTGLAVNNSFGYPMGFPAFVLRWQLDGQYELGVQLMNAASVTVNRRFTDRFKLGVIFEANGSMAMEKWEGKKMMFSHTYMITALKPEFRLGKSISIPIFAGITADRTAFYEEAKLKAFFKAMDREYDPRFTIAPYFSVAFRVGF